MKQKNIFLTWMHSQSNGILLTKIIKIQTVLNVKLNSRRLNLNPINFIMNFLTIICQKTKLCIILTTKKIETTKILYL